MARKKGITPDDVVDAAEALADTHGLEGVTLAAVAERLGVRSPSLYAHIGGLGDLHRRLALRAAAVMREAFAEAVEGRSGAAALRCLAETYRAVAQRHPGLYAAAQKAVAPGDDDDLYDALRAAVEPVVDALARAGIRRDDLIHVTRAFRSSLHGFVELERQGGFGLPESVDESFERLVELLLSGIRGLARKG